MSKEDDLKGKEVFGGDPGARYAKAPRVVRETSLPHRSQQLRVVAWVETNPERYGVSGYYGSKRRVQVERRGIDATGQPHWAPVGDEVAECLAWDLAFGDKVGIDD